MTESWEGERGLMSKIWRFRNENYYAGGLKIEKLLFYLFVFVLPFQTRWIIYQYGGSFNEWTSIYLYLTDILLLAVFLFWFWRRKNERHLQEGLKISQRLKTVGFWLAVFLIVAFISLVNAKNISLGFYGWFKLLEMVTLFFYLKSNAVILSPPEASEESRGTQRSNDGKINFRNLARIFVLSGLFQSIIALGQFINQESLGLKWLAESPLALDKVGVAKIAVVSPVGGAVKMLRAYGSLPHSNVLAAFLLVCLFFLFFLWLSRERSLTGNAFFSAAFYLMFFGLCLTFSRTIILTFLLASFLYFVICLWQVTQTIDIGLFKRLVLVFLIFIISAGFFAFAFWPEISSRFNVSLNEEAVSLRIFYNETALAAISRQPLLGLGLANFVWEIRNELNLLASWLHQPVHNIYLLIAAETGLFGLIAFLMFIIRLLTLSLRGVRLRQMAEADDEAILFILRNLSFLLFLSFLFIGLFDHFFLTLQQGQLLFWLVLGLIVSFSAVPCQKEER